MALYKFDFMFMLCYVASGETAAGWPAGWPYRSRPVLQDAAIALPLQPSVCECRSVVALSLNSFSWCVHFYSPFIPYCVLR